MYQKKEGLKTREPSAKYCRKCKYATKPIEVRGVKIDRSAYAMCEKYDRKPNDVLMHDALCEFYEAKK